MRAKKNMTHLKTTAFLIALAVFTFCLPVFMACTRIVSASNGGFGSETTNGVVSGAVILPNGSAATGARVILRRTDYVSSLSALGGLAKRCGEIAGNGFTDAKGLFTIDSVDTGSYTMEINDELAHAVCEQLQITQKKNTFNSGIDTLKAYATIHGEVNIGSTRGKSYVQMPGLERLVPVEPDGSYTVNDLPAGIFTLRIVNSDTAAYPVVINGIATKPGVVTEAPISGWPQSRSIVLNTSPTGADIAGDVFRFPVLIRLTNNNFDFSTAKRGGWDVRFAKADGALLPYEIERWDSASGLAEIWVTVDTIRGGNALQSIQMLWGNPGAKDNSSSAEVFDTANGFRAVWHLNQNCDDATYYKNNGTNYGAGDTAGMIGFGKKFNGSGFIEIPDLLGSPSTFTLSAWAQLDSTQPGGGGEILTIGDAALIRMDYSLGGMGTMGSIHLFSHVKDTAYYNVSSGLFFKKTGWHLIAFTVDQNNHRQNLFIDGTNVQADTGVNSVADYAGVGQTTLIGKHGNGKTTFNFFGRIDEVRVCVAARSVDWIKLCYMNQKAQDALVVIEK